MEGIKKSKVLMRNLPWLQGKGFIVEKKEEWPWVNVYYDNERASFGACKYKTKDEADHASGTGCITTIQLKPAK
jgi:hypothetical protein